MLRKILAVTAVSLLLTYSASVRAGTAALISVTSVGTPLPLTCAGPTAPAPCVYGYVYYGVSPISGANVTINSQFGTLPVLTSSGGFGSQPYFQASLGGPPLLVSGGDTITLTTSLSGSIASKVYQVLAGGQQVDLVVRSSYSFGDGSDGPLTVSSDATESPIDSAATGTIGSFTLSATHPSFDTGQLILIHQSQGAGAGTWMQNEIASYSVGTISLTTALNATYSAGAQVRVLKQYTNVTINSGKTYSAKTWNGTVGGIVAFLASGTVAINGTIQASGNSGIDQQLTVDGQTAPGAAGVGFRGGAFYGKFGSAGGYAGEGVLGVGGIQASAYGNAGGGGTHNGDPNGGSGGGGGNGASGTSASGSNGVNGAGGAAAGSEDLSSMVFGGGGGGGSKVTTVTAGGGGAGGGIIMLVGKTIALGGSGAMASNGGNGGSGSGGGAGGSILLTSQNATLGTTLVTASGGTGTALSGAGQGGDGGVGRIHLSYYLAYIGTTSPALNTQPISCAAAPVPTINSISPIVALQSQDTIQFVGEASSPDLCGTTITAYVWRSESQIVISTQASFTRTAASLTPGTYPIYFKARDSNNVWSEEISRTITIQASNTATPTSTATRTPTATATPTQATPGPGELFLPMVVRAFGGLFEIEPNNPLALANGPIAPGLDYYGYQNDANDYFSFYSAGGNISATLTDTSAPGTQLYLYYQDTSHQVDHAGGAPYHVDYNGAAGWYYVRVSASAPFNTTTPYTLKVTYP